MRSFSWCKSSSVVSYQNKHRRRTMFLAVAANVGFASCLAPFAQAQDLWVGGSGDEWSTATNWSTGLPQSTDDAINTTAEPIDFNTNATFNSFLTNGAFSLSGGTLAGGQANAASTIEVDNVLTFNGGGLSNVTLSQGVGGSVDMDDQHDQRQSRC
jgi:hypothetical protein